jgi:predicted GNAT superfamily acetyltransferase
MPKPVLDSNRPHAASPTRSIEVRPLRTHDEFARCVELQNDVWGAEFSERVPAALLKVTQRIGGIAAGAFDGADLLGFVFGMTGLEDDRLVHWSDMLAVREDMRDHGIGRRLKAYQRDTLRERGIARMYWTFDPLVSRNAHLNINRLGARVTEYVPNMYGGDTSSVLHRGLGTDRFIVSWDLDDEPPRATHVSASPLDAPVLNPVSADGLPVVPDLTGHATDTVARIAIPAAIDRVQAESISTATRWRASTRCVILWAIDAGYRVTGFVHEDAADVSYYICTPTSPSGPTQP